MSFKNHKVSFMQKPDIQDLSNFLIAYISAMMVAGTYTSRVARCVERIAKTYGYEININFFFHHSSINIVDNKDYAINRTYIIPNKIAQSNFQTILDLSVLSWAIYDHKYDLNIAKDYFAKLMQQKKRAFWTFIFFSSLANAAFSRLFGGDFYAMCIVFIASFVGVGLRQFFTHFKVDMRIQYIICAFISSWLAFVSTKFLPTQTADIALGSSILYLIPGVFFINSVIDILRDHILMGLSRIINIAILVCCIAIGIYTTLMISEFGVLK